ALLTAPRDRGRPDGRRAGGPLRLRSARGHRAVAEDGQALDRRRPAADPLHAPVQRRAHEGPDRLRSARAAAVRAGQAEVAIRHHYPLWTLSISALAWSTASSLTPASEGGADITPASAISVRWYVDHGSGADVATDTAGIRALRFVSGTVRAWS